MIEETLIVGLVLECRRIEHAWAEAQGRSHAWRPVAVLPAAPDVAVWTPLGSTQQGRRFYAGAQTVHLYSTETANYRDNLASGRPQLWVVLRGEGAEPPVEVASVTADPAEGEAMTEAGTNTVETIDMPDVVAAEVAAFVEAHHVERPMIKRKRDRAGPGRDQAGPGRDRLGPGRDRGGSSGGGAP